MQIICIYYHTPMLYICQGEIGRSKRLLSIEPSLLLPIGSVRPCPFLALLHLFHCEKQQPCVHRRALFCPQGAPKGIRHTIKPFFDFPFAGSRNGIPPGAKIEMPQE